MLSRTHYDLTVVVPVYNGESYIHQCYKSIHEQTNSLGNATVQVVFVNDGSEDGTASVICDIAAANNDVYIVTQENQGLGPSRNAGIDNALGDYIAFLDVDDRFGPGHLSTLYGEAKRYECDVCCGGYTIERNGVRTVFPNHYAGRLFDARDIHVYYEHIFGAAPEERIEDLVPVSSCFGLYRTEFLRLARVEFLPILSEDTVFNAEVLPKAARLYCSAEVGYVYCMDNLQSITRKYDPNKKQRLVCFFAELLKAAEKVERETGRGGLVLRAHRKIISNTRGYIIFICGQPQLGADECRKEIEFLLDNAVVSKALETYPVRKLGFRYGFFAYLMRCKMVMPLIYASRAAFYMKK